MRVLTLLMLLCALMLPAAAQSAPGATVAVESAFMRAAPDETADPAGSTYEGEILRVVGRNADGLWLNVHRPPTPDRHAWIRRDMVTFSGDLTLLPLTDFVTGVTGTEPVFETGFAALVISEAQMRPLPDRFAASSGVVPVGIVVPVVERTPDTFWLKVNYLGTVGWIAEFLTVTGADLLDVPVAPETAGDPAYAALEIIDPALQIAQIDRLLTYLTPTYTTAENVAFYWKQILLGETRECLPPADVPAYSITAADMAELPELRRQTRELDRAYTSLNESIAAMRKCGIYLGGDVNSAYGRALTARSAYDLIIRRMNILREQLAVPQ